MKRFGFYILSTLVLIAALALTAAAQQTDPSPPQQQPQAQQPPRGRGAAKAAATPSSQPPRSVAADPAKRAQQQRNKTAQAIVDTYVGGFQKNVGLSDEQTQKFSKDLGDYVRRQLMLANRHNEAMKRLKELSDQHASDADIQAQNDLVEMTEKQLSNSERKFYADMNPQLTAQQRANLILYMNRTSQSIRQAIQKSNQ